VRRNASFAGKRVGDFGCGYEASLARTAIGSASELTVVDVTLADELKADERVTAVEGPLPDSLRSLSSASFDVILCLSVLEHLTEPQRMLDEMHRLMAPGGVALINVPSWAGKRMLELSAFRLGLSPAEEMDDHKRYYDPRDLWPLLVAAGWRPSGIGIRRHKFRLNTFAVCRVPDA
jgi:2-polyprenyl-3-methyl-5-hydroxy-6-metoxy-1,4-benzoquinol methylase